MKDGSRSYLPTCLYRPETASGVAIHLSRSLQWKVINLANHHLINLIKTNKEIYVLECYTTGRLLPSLDRDLHDRKNIIFPE
jgi:hypothetical protein